MDFAFPSHTPPRCDEPFRAREETQPTVHTTRGAAGNLHPPRLVSVGQGRGPTPPADHPRRLTTTHLRLRMRPERPHHAVNAAPRAHQLGIVAEPIAHQPVEQPCPKGPARLLRASSRTR